MDEKQITMDYEEWEWLMDVLQNYIQAEYDSGRYDGMDQAGKDDTDYCWEECQRIREKYDYDTIYA